MGKNLVAVLRVIASEAHFLKMAIIADIDNDILVEKCVSIRKRCLNAIDKFEEVK
jgi:hypothetical protein